MENLIYFFAIVLLDSFLYGYCYEIKLRGFELSRGLFKFSIFDWIFGLIKTPVAWLFDDIRRYRVFQKLVELSGLIIIFVNFGWMPLIGLLLAHYLQSFDLGYYVVLDQVDLIHTSYDHLIKWYTFGGVLWYINSHAYNPIQFVVSGILGFILLSILGSI